MKEKSDKSFVVTLLLLLFLGWVGVHRFYVGKAGTGFFFFITFGWFGIGVLLDFIMLICNSFTDKQGNFVKP